MKWPDYRENYNKHVLDSAGNGGGVYFRVKTMKKPLTGDVVDSSDVIKISVLEIESKVTGTITMTV